MFIDSEYPEQWLEYLNVLGRSIYQTPGYSVNATEIYGSADNRE